MRRHLREYLQIGRPFARLAPAPGGRVVDVVAGVATSFHDAAIAVIAEDGRVFAEALERPAQIKRSLMVGGWFYGVRALAKSFVGGLAQRGDLVRVMVRFTWKPHPLVRIFCDLYIRALRLRARFALKAEPRELPPPIVYTTRAPQIWYWDSNLFHTHTFQNELFPKNAVEVRNRGTEHHMCHAANAVFTSPFDACAVLVLDGQGEWHSLTGYRYERGKFELVTSSRDSLGLLYADVTTLCGFSPADGEEWKVMGLAGYGEVDQRLYEVFRNETHLTGSRVKLTFDEKAVRKLREICGGFRSPGEDPLKAARLAASFQQYFADVLVELARALQRETGEKNLAYAGGCALNSAANGRLSGAETGFDVLHVPSAPADDGNALGAALWERHVVRRIPYLPRTMSPYLGSSVDQDELARILKLSGIPHRTLPDAALWDEVARLLDAGEIVGVMHGRAEFGPRALGHRSLLADPRRAEMKQEINRLVKFREDYRPLAPAILHEHGPAYFEGYQASPYMERALPFKASAKAKVPAVVHADGTGRLQSVTAELTPRFHALIEAFHKRTGVPVLVNTSLNVMGKPIVHAVQDAVQLLYTSGLRHLVVENTLLSKTSENPSSFEGKTR